MAATSRFHWADYVVTVSMLLASLGIGFFFALFKGGQKTKDEYLLGNRQMSVAPVCLSLFVTFQSAISLIGLPADVYNTGSMTIYIYIGIGLSYIVGYYTVVPVMYPLHLTSVYEYLELRFESRAVRILGTCIGMFQTILYMAVALFSPGLALQAAAGLPLWVSVVIVGGIGTIYTAVGGIKSVIWTDAFQTIVVFIGMGTVLFKGLNTVGGFSNMMDIAQKGGRLIWDDISPDPRVRHSMWGCSFGMMVMWLVNNFNQSSVQRLGSLKTQRAAGMAFLLNIPLNMIYGTVLTITGLLLYAYVVTIGCDPYHAGLIHNKNQMMPYFVIHVLDDLPGFAGLYMSMLFSGALSTVSSGINALAANTVEDLLTTPLKGCKDSTVTVIAKGLVVCYGMVTIGLAYGIKALQGPVTQLASSAFGACGGPIVGMLMLGGGFPRANKYGALFGGIAGIVINMWLAVGNRLYGKPIASLPPGPIDHCTSHLYNSTTAPTIDVLGFLHNTSGANVSGSGHGGQAAMDYSSAATVVGRSVFESFNGSTTVATDMVVDDSFSIYDLSYVWFGLAGLLTTFISGVIFSFFTGGNDVESLDSRLIFPFCRRLYGIPEPLHRPEDMSNAIALKNYQQAWDTFKKRGLQQEEDVLPEKTSSRMEYKVIVQNESSGDDGDGPLPHLIGERTSEHVTFLQHPAHKEKTHDVKEQ